MRLSPLLVRLDSGDLDLERFDAGVQFLDRERIEVLTSKLGQRIAWLAREKIVDVHATDVDPSRAAVNKLRRERGP